jgi:phosphoglycerate dehydrogenase-like enzyme
MSKRHLVVVTDYLAEPGYEISVLGDIADVHLLQATDEADLVQRGGSADALITFHEISLTEQSMSALPNCRGIVRCGVGVDNVDLEAAGRRGIVVCNVPDYGTEEVADHALLCLLALARRLLPADQSVRAGLWHPSVVFGAPRLRRGTLGLIGCGRIGTAMALRGKALGMRVSFYDPYKADGFDKALGIQRCDRLSDLLMQSEFVSLHCPLTPETYHILNAETLVQLPVGAYIINTARGGCIDPTALLEALDGGRLNSAALDVIENEPLTDERIRQHPKLLLTPHVAFYSAEGYAEMRTKAAQEVRRMLTGEPVRNPVNVAWLADARCKIFGGK